jgi:hypothetical protein
MFKFECRDAYDHWAFIFAISSKSVASKRAANWNRIGITLRLSNDTSMWQRLYSLATNLSQQRIARYLLIKAYKPGYRVGITTGYRLDGRGSIPGRGKRLFLFHCVQTGSRAHPGALSSGIKRRGVKLTTHHHLVLKSSMLELYLHYAYLFMELYLIKYRGDLKTKLRGFGPQANYTDRAIAACWRS